MRSLYKVATAALAVTTALLGTGCAGAIIEPGHRALRFDPKAGGLQKEVVQPGYVPLHCGVFSTVCPRVDDFDVTYSTAREEITTNSQEGLALNLRLSIIYRPIIAELYQLDTEIGPNYYDEVVQPEFKSAARGVFAHHSYMDLQKKNEKIENEIESEVRRRIAGKHIEISSVLLESVEYAPEIAANVRAKIVFDQETARKKAAMENEAAQQKQQTELLAAQRKLEIESKAANDKLATESAATQEKLQVQNAEDVTKMKLQAEAEQKELELKLAAEEETARIDSQMRNKKAERQLTVEQAQIDKMKADAEAASRVSSARGEATARLALAQAEGEEKKAEAQSLTPMHVMMHAYDALAHLGGTGTTIMLGDFSHMPAFLFPKVPAFQSAFTLPWSPYPGTMPYFPPQPTAIAPPAAPSDSTFSNTK
jgi:regulator of protease activity HflC (stomatin/prohibitin superfamily)